MSYITGSTSAQKSTYRHATEEIKAMRDIRHLNVIRLIGYDLKTTVDGKESIVCIQELAENGEVTFTYSRVEFVLIMWFF